MEDKDPDVKYAVQCFLSVLLIIAFFMLVYIATP
jgi:hypothetical protein